MATNFTEQELIEQEQRQDYFKDSATQTIMVELELSRSALRRVRAGFNPSKMRDVAKFHMLAAALITACEKLRDRPKPLIDPDHPDVPLSKLHEAIDDAARNAAIAITEFENGCMHGVKAATAEAYMAGN